MFCLIPYVEGENLKIERRTLRDSSNPMELSDYEFGKHFRVNKDIFLTLLNTITPHLRPIKRCTFILPITKLAVFLNFLGTGSYQNGAGSSWLCMLSQPVVSRIISEHLNIFEEQICSKYIVLNDAADEEIIKKEYFYQEYKIPGVVGCIDGTHIKIVSPSTSVKQDYLNRNGFYSLNVMLICDHNLKIKYVDARYPGANHDSFIWKNSEARKYFDEQYRSGKKNTWLLGDFGYPLEIFLLTPFRSPSQPNELKFNECHSKARNTIVRCIGILKNRFRSISSEKLHYNPQKATQIINACCALHNICIKYKHNLEFEISYSENTEEENIIDKTYIASYVASPTSSIAYNIRDAISNSLQNM